MTIGTRQMGSTISEIKVNLGCLDRSSATRVTTAMGYRIIEEKDWSMRPCIVLQSLHTRDISSPVLAVWKKLEERFCKWPNSSVRKSAMACIATQFIR